MRPVQRRIHSSCILTGEGVTEQFQGNVDQCPVQLRIHSSCKLIGERVSEQFQGNVEIHSQGKLLRTHSNLCTGFSEMLIARHSHIYQVRKRTHKDRVTAIPDNIEYSKQSQKRQRLRKQKFNSPHTGRMAKLYLSGIAKVPVGVLVYFCWLCGFIYLNFGITFIGYVIY